ncbi:TerB family tellurite resistance protein [Actinospica robiniae]|uniref:tellurite resistance TerB family protein n=1 Tax=Actinospica robiniae TaxID=304901 RepID=UPI00041ACAB3|nr:TerB family tellurite resistance protein [Actinospica robiniae]
MLLLVWGFKVFYKVLDTGTFFCPRCGGDRAFEHRVGKKWFRLYWIPLFPCSGPINEHVRCTTCQGMYTLQALNHPTSNQLSSLLLDGVRGVLVHVLRAGSIQSPGPREIAVSEIQAHGLPGYDDASLQADLDVVPGDISGLLTNLGGQLAGPGKEDLLRAAVRVALADGPLTDLERNVVNSTGAILGMTQAHALGVIAMTEQSAQR